MKPHTSGSAAGVLPPALHCTCLPSSHVVLFFTEIVLWPGSPISKYKAAHDRTVVGKIEISPFLENHA